MGIYTNSAIGDVYVGDSKIDKVFVGEDLVYTSVPPIDYFYFEIDDPTLTAQVGFNEIKLATKGISSISYDSSWDSYFQTYSPLELSYSFDMLTWIPYNLGDTINLGTNYNINKVYFRGINNAPSFEVVATNSIEEGQTHCLLKRITAFINSQTSAGVSAGGDIRSLRHYNDINLNTPPCEYAYASLFRECSLLTHPPKLPYTVMTNRCYGSMFAGCTSLTIAPELPATTLALECYGTACGEATLIDSLWLDDDHYFSVDGMFGKCTSLTTAPALPATTLTNKCYYLMFAGCRSLVNAPALPATTLTYECYAAMFAGCRSLVNAPALPATTLAERCYGALNMGMFDDCRSLISAPALPATTLAEYCYQSMFDRCVSLINPPILPATTLAAGCYYMMFAQCTSLTIPPALPATTLAKSCYSYMFSGCKNLTRIPNLPVLSIPDSAYEDMYNQSSVRGNDSSSGVCNKAYRIPSAGDGTAGSKALNGMFTNIDGSDDNNYTPSINTTFYINVPSF